MTHLKKITLKSLLVFCVGLTTHVMADGMPENWSEMVERAKKIQKEKHLKHPLVVSANPFAGKNNN